MVSVGGGEAVSAGLGSVAGKGGACQSRTVVSWPPVARVLPSGENAIGQTSPSWPPVKAPSEAAAQSLSRDLRPSGPSGPERRSNCRAGRRPRT